jgi:DNA-directed RNA polymerase I, II, and III subunit RPABC2
MSSHLDDEDIESANGSDEEDEEPKQPATMIKPLAPKKPLAESDEDDDDDDASKSSDDASDIDSQADPEEEEDEDNPISNRDTGNANLASRLGLGQLDNDNNEDDDDDDDEEDEQYLQKFDENLKTNIIAEYHPEMLSLNYDEVDILTRVVRNMDGQVIDPLHRTLPFLTKYEKARVLGERSKQLNSGAKPFVEVDPSVVDGYLIAMAEFEQKKIPFIVKRPMPNGGCEYWKLRDLEVL